MKRKHIKNWWAVIACGLLTASNALGIMLNDPGVVGTVESGEPAGATDEVGYVNYLLALPANSGPVSYDGHIYKTSSTDYNGTVTLGVKDETGNVFVPSGWEFVLAKYDGPNGGDVLWYLGGASFELPGKSDGLWENDAGKGYGISHFTVFNSTASVPEGGSTLVLLGVVLFGLGILNKRIA
jgi:hypothetical protein